MKRGEKVICLDAGRCSCPLLPPERRRLPPLIKGNVYVVASIGEVLYGSIVNLIGVDPSPHLGFAPERFRLLSEIKGIKAVREHISGVRLPQERKAIEV
jgi:hypothetical protein